MASLSATAPVFILLLGVLFFVLFLKGCRNMIGRNRNSDHRAGANARIQGNNQSTNENGAPSPSAPSHNETREQKQHNRRSKILTTILQKVRFCQQQQKQLMLWSSLARQHNDFIICTHIISIHFLCAESS
jgi:hypothetical protein